MTTTTAAAFESSAQTSNARPHAASGAAGLIFFVTVVINNVLRAKQPLPAATAEEVAAWYAQNSTGVWASQALFGVAVPCLLLFAVGTYQRFCADPRARTWSAVGAVGVCLMTPLFGAMMAFDLALSARAGQLAETPAMTNMLWSLKSAFFALNVLPLAVGLGAFGIASLSSNVGPRWVAYVAMVGMALGIFSIFFVRQGLSGSPLGMLGLGTFVAWLVFLVATGVQSVRARA